MKPHETGYADAVRERQVTTGTAPSQAIRNVAGAVVVLVLVLAFSISPIRAPDTRGEREVKRLSAEGRFDAWSPN